MGAVDNYGFTKDLILNTDPPLYIWHIYHTAYKFDLSGVPSNAYNISAYLEAYRLSGSYNSKIVSVPDNLNLYYLEDCYYRAHIGDEYFTVDINPGTDHDITSYVVPRLSQGYINFGLRGTDYVGYHTGSIKVILKIYYDTPKIIMADNNFTDNSGNNTHGEIIVSGFSGNQIAPFPFSRKVTESVSLTAISPQNDNQNHQMLWYGGAVNRSEWKRNNEFAGNDQTKTFTVTESDNGTTYQAQLRKNYAISRNNQTEFNGTISNPNLWYIVEQNSGQINAPYTYTPGSITYNFAGWTDDFNASAKRTINPTDNETYSVLFKTVNRSNDPLAFSNSSQRKFVKTDDGWLHKVYESMGHVWYETSSDNGVTWTINNNGKPLDNGEGKLPSIAYSKKVVIPQVGITWNFYQTFIVFQEKSGSGYKIKVNYFHHFVCVGCGGDDPPPPSPVRTEAELGSGDNYSIDAAPVIGAYKNSVGYNYFTAVWKNSGGLYAKSGYLNMDSVIEPFIFLNTGNYITTSTYAINPSISYSGNTLYISHLAWEENNSIKYASLNGSQISG